MPSKADSQSTPAIQTIVFPSPIPSVDFGGDGPDLVFLHANGYPPASYRHFLALLSKENRVKALVQRPLWKNSRPQDIQDWSALTDDLLRFLDQNRSRAPKAVVGHSMGGIAALRAALHQPQRFQRLVLLDPVLLPPSFIVLWNIARLFKFAHRLHPHLLSALKRRREFENLDFVFKRYRRRPTFKYMDDDALRAYVEGITRPRENGGYELVYSPEWESHIYYASIWNDMDIWRDLPGLEVPTLIVRGAETDTFWESTAKLVKQKQPRVRIETVDQATHLVPLERPREVYELVQSFLKESQ